MRTRPLSLLLPVAIALALAACGPGDDAGGDPASEGAPAPGGDAAPAGDAAASPPAAAAGGGTAPAAAASTYVLDCGGKRVAATFNGEDSVTLQSEAQTITLGRAEAVAGKRYADAAGNQWSGETVKATMLSLGGQPAIACRSSGTPEAAPAAPPA